MNATWNRIVIAFVFMALIHLVLETTPAISENYGALLLILDGIITMVFITDFVFKLQAAKDRYQDSQRIREFLKGELIIDLLSILPFFMAILFSGFEYLAVLRLLRLMRIFKLFNLVKSHALIINAMRSKKYELYISMQVVILITVILSAILYFVENPSQPENFSSITDAFLWSISKFIGEIGGYGDFAPITLMGKILATFVGILGIAIFAVPAGIIASGFVEEIESIKKSEENDHFYDKIAASFSTEHLVNYIRAKANVKLEHIRRKMITFNDVKFKMNIPEANLLAIAEMERSMRIRNYMKEGKEYTVVEFFEDNAVYGTFNNRGSKVTVISTHSKDQPFMGHFSYALSEYLKANYVSVEKYSATDFDPEKSVNFALNDAYLEETGCDAIEVFKKDLASLSENNALTILVRAAGSGFDNFEVLNGKAAGEDFCSLGGTFDDVSALSMFRTEFQKIVKNNAQTIGFQSRLGNNEENNLALYLKNTLNMNNLQIHVGADLLKEDAGLYYKTLEVVGEGFKTLIATESAEVAESN
jgi:voltage-gated potassium channel